MLIDMLVLYRHIKGNEINPTYMNDCMQYQKILKIWCTIFVISIWTDRPEQTV